MNHEAPVDRVRKALQALETQGSPELLFAMLDPQVRWRASAPPGTALHGTFVGPQGVADYFGRSQELVDTLQVTTTDLLDRGDRVVVLGHERLRLRATGAERALDWAMVMTFAGDTVADVLVLEDLSILLDAR